MEAVLVRLRVFAVFAGVLLMSGCSAEGNPVSGETEKHVEEPSLTVPAPLSGEIARSVYEVDGSSVDSRGGKANLKNGDYVVQGACAGANGLNVEYRIRVDGDVVTAGGITCNEAETLNSVGEVRFGADVQIELILPPNGLTNAYAVVAPAP